MNPKRVVCLIAVLLLPGPAWAQEELPTQETPPSAVAQKPKRKPRRKRLEAEPEEKSGLSWEGKLELGAGAFSGKQIRPGQGGLAQLGAGVELTWEQGALRLELPVEAEQVETPGTSLRETRGGAGLELTWKAARGLRLQLGVGATGSWRPGWDDLYQPRVGGGFVSTDRYSYLQPRLDARVRFSALRDHTLVLAYGYQRPDYLDDPNYDPVSEPMHIAPSDHSFHQADLGWSWDLETFTVGAHLEGSARFDSVLLSRDAGTGATHAGAGGAPPNPLQTLYALSPGVEVDWELGPLNLEVAYDYEVVVDAFQGYYSFTGHHPGLGLAYRSDPLTLKLGAQAWLREYGPDSYAAGGSHPALDSGDRRVDRRLALTLRSEYRLWQQLSATLEGGWTVRETNFPDYQPNLFPASRSYDIDWDYVNLRALAGLAYRF